MSILKTNLVAAQCRMKVQANKKRSERVFEVGDMVYLGLVLYQHMSLATHLFHKLQPQFYGPFPILDKVGPVAYKFKLPDHSKLYHVFHVSCLKKQLGATVQSTVPLPVVTEVDIFQDVLVAILDRRMVKKNNYAITKVLVKWENHSTDDATWEVF